MKGYLETTEGELERNNLQQDTRRGKQMVSKKHMN